MKKKYINPYTTVVTVDLSSAINVTSVSILKQRAIGDEEEDFYEDDEEWDEYDEEDIWGD